MVEIALLPPISLVPAHQPPAWHSILCKLCTANEDVNFIGLTVQSLKIYDFKSKNKKMKGSHKNTEFE